MGRRVRPSPGADLGVRAAGVRGPDLLRDLVGHVNRVIRPRLKLH
jgi:hypothetical protein